MPANSDFIFRLKAKNLYRIDEAAKADMWDHTTGSTSYWYIPADATRKIKVPEQYSTIAIISRIYFSVPDANTFSNFYSCLVNADGGFNRLSIFDSTPMLTTNQFLMRSGTFFSGPGVDWKNYIRFYGPNADKYYNTYLTDTAPMYVAYMPYPWNIEQWKSNLFVTASYDNNAIPDTFYPSYQFTSTIDASNTDIKTSMAIYALK